MGELGYVLFHVDALDADAAPLSIDRDLQVAVGAEREVVLRNLVPLHQIGVGVVLAVEFAVLGDAAVQSESNHDDRLDGLAVYDGQGARQPEANGTDPRVGLGVLVVGRAGAVHLAAGAQLSMHFQPDHGLILGHGHQL